MSTQFVIFARINKFCLRSFCSLLVRIPGERCDEWINAEQCREREKSSFECAVLDSAHDETSQSELTGKLVAGNVSKRQPEVFHCKSNHNNMSWAAVAFLIADGKAIKERRATFSSPFFVVASRPKLHRKFRAPEKRANRAAHCASQANVFAFDEQKSFLLNIPSLSVVASGTFRCESWLKFCFECFKVSVEFKAKWAKVLGEAESSCDTLKDSTGLVALKSVHKSIASHMETCWIVLLLRDSAVLSAAQWAAKLNFLHFHSFLCASPLPTMSRVDGESTH